VPEKSHASEELRSEHKNYLSGMVKKNCSYNVPTERRNMNGGEIKAFKAPLL